MKKTVKRATPEPGLVEGPLWTGATAVSPPEVSTPVEMPKVRPRSRWRTWFWSSALLFVVGVVLYDVMSFLALTWDSSPFLGAAFTALFCLVVFSGVGAIHAEFRETQKLKRAEHDHHLAIRLLEANQYGNALPFTEKVLKSLPVPEAVQDRFKASVFDTHSDRDVLLLFGRIVLEPLDRQAYAIVLRAARDSAVGVAASPVAALDAILTLWRGLRMIREVAAVYVFRPGTPGTVILTHRLLLDTTLVATADVLGNLWAEHLGGRVAGILSTKLGEGVFAAVRVARLGLLAMELCRPLPFGKEDEPNLNRLRKEVVSSVVLP